MSHRAAEKPEHREPGPFGQFVIGGKDNQAETIKDIIACTNDLVIYVVEDGRLKFETVTERPSAREVQIFTCYDRLKSLIARLLSRRKAGPLLLDLGAALFAAMSDQEDKGDVERYFKDVTEQITMRALDISRSVYLIYGVLFACITSLLIYLRWIYPVARFEQVSPFAVGATGGIIGSALSIWIRSANLAISPYKRIIFSAFQGVSRIALGALFGFIFICCVKADLLLGAVAQNAYALFAFSIVAGFSETYVPELLKRMEKEGHSSRRRE